jgi:hypothetical protein
MRVDDMARDICRSYAQGAIDVADIANTGITTAQAGGILTTSHSSDVESSVCAFTHSP